MAGRGDAIPVRLGGDGVSAAMFCRMTRLTEENPLVTSDACT